MGERFKTTGDLIRYTTGQTAFARYATPGERRVARKLVQALLSLGCQLSVYDSEMWVVQHSQSEKQVIDMLATAGDDIVRVHDSGGDYLGTFDLLWGQGEDGEELISDHTDNEFCNAVASFVDGSDEASLDALHHHGGPA